MGDSGRQLETLGNSRGHLGTEGDGRGLLETLGNSWRHWATAEDIWGLRETAGDSEPQLGTPGNYMIHRYIYNTLNDIHAL